MTKSIEQQTRDASAIIFGISILCITAFFFLSLFGLSGCAHHHHSEVGPMGATGATGATGPQGLNGLNALFGVLSEAPLATCPNSGQDSNGGYGQVFTMGVDLNRNGVLEVSEVQETAIVCNGQNGVQGVPGVAGTNGTNGTNGINGSNGTNGSNGATGATGVQGVPGVSPLYSPVAVIEPCGAASSSYKEVLLGLEGGFVLSEFSGSATNADLVRNSMIPNGTYQDTDDSACVFTVSSDNAGNTTVSWAAQTCANGYHANAGSSTYTASTSTWSASN